MEDNFVKVHEGGSALGLLPSQGKQDDLSGVITRVAERNVYYHRKVRDILQGFVLLKVLKK